MVPVFCWSATLEHGQKSVVDRCGVTPVEKTVFSFPSSCQVQISFDCWWDFVPTFLWVEILSNFYTYGSCVPWFCLEDIGFFFFFWEPSITSGSYILSVSYKDPDPWNEGLDKDILSSTGFCKILTLRIVWLLQVNSLKRLSSPLVCGSCNMLVGLISLLGSFSRRTELDFTLGLMLYPGSDSCPFTVLDVSCGSWSEH